MRTIGTAISFHLMRPSDWLTDAIGGLRIMLTVMLLVPGLAAMEKSLLLMFVVLLGGALLVGGHEAWKMRRGALGWIVSIVAAVVGGTVGGMALAVVATASADAISRSLAPSWVELDATAGLIAMLVGIVLGAKLALRGVNQLR